MKRGPAFQFYPGDWLSSGDILNMTLAEEGAYIRLLSYMWLDPQCSLPDNDKELAMLSRLGTVGWRKSGHTLRKKFRAEGERLYNDRLLLEIKKQEAWVRKSSAGGQKSAAAREAKKTQGWLSNGTHQTSSGPVEPNANRPVEEWCEPNVNSSSSSSSSSSKPKSKSFGQEPRLAWFEIFWKTYPRKTAKAHARKAFLAKIKTEADRDRLQAAAERDLPALLDRDPQYVPHPATYVNSEPWDNEISADESKSKAQKIMDLL